jgi:hypothetical protein
MNIIPGIMITRFDDNVGYLQHSDWRFGSIWKVHKQEHQQRNLMKGFQVS